MLSILIIPVLVNLFNGNLKPDKVAIYIALTIALLGLYIAFDLLQQKSTNDKWFILHMIIITVIIIGIITGLIVALQGFVIIKELINALCK